MSSFKSEIAPKGMEFKSNEFIISDKYATILTIVSYPKYIRPGYLANLTNIAGVKLVAKHIPIDYTTMSKTLNKEIADLKMRYQTENDKTIQERLRQDYESLDSFIKMIASTQSRIFDFQLHLLIMADSKEELDMKKVQVRGFLEALSLQGVPLLFEQEKVLKSILPIFPKQDIENRIGIPIPSPTLAAMYPFIFDSVKDPGNATLFGVDFSGGVVLFNQFLYKEKKESNRVNANMIILGASGSGKSTAAKLLLRTHIRSDYKVIAIDPEGELEDLCKNVGGDFLDLGRGGEYGLINPLEVVLDADDDTSANGAGYAVLTRTLQSLKAFMKYYSPSIEDDVLTLFSEVVQDTYKRFKIDFETDFTKLTSEDYPTFDDVYATINGKILNIPEETHEKDILRRLEIKIRPLVKELRYYFTGKTSLNINSNLIVFNIRELMTSDENVRNALFFNILKYAWGMCLDVETTSVLYVDEAHVLLSSRNELGAEFLAQIQRRSRKYNSGTIIITQQPTDFAAPNLIMHGKAIFDNASYYLIMNLKKQAVDDLALLIDLNESEKDTIKYYNQGEGLFVCGNRRMRIKVVCTQEELDSFGASGGF